MTEHHFDTMDENTNGHSLFSASSSAGWLNCQDYVKANYGKPDTSGVDAAYGTVAHAVAEQWGKSGIRPDHLVGTIEYITQPYTGEVFAIPIDEEMMSHVGAYVDQCRNTPGAHFWERRVDYSQYTPISNQGGTSDHFTLQPGWLIIDDLKMGRGVFVEVDHNTQAMLYALGVILAWDWLYDIERVTIRIFQPRMNNYGVWETTKAEIMAFAQTVLEKSSAALRPERTRTATLKGCQWCKVVGCTALFKMMADMSEDAFEYDAEVTSEQMDQIEAAVVDETFTVDPKNVRELSNETIGKYLPYRKLFEAHWKELWQEAEKRVFAHAKVPGVKVVDGHNSRDWKNELAAKQELNKLGVDDLDLFKSEFASPNQAEDALRKKLGISKKAAEAKLKKFTTTSSGKPRMVLDSDAREEFSSDGAFDYDVDNADGL